MLVLLSLLHIYYKLQYFEETFNNNMVERLFYRVNYVLNDYLRKNEPVNLGNQFFWQYTANFGT